MRLYGSLTKIDTEQRIVAGYASTEAVDAQGETVLKAAIEEALDDYMEFANIREMHQLSAVGTAEEASVDDKGLYLCAKVVDDTAWGKVTSGVYKGFSVGGKVLARDKDDKKIITKILLTEISLVDRPSNPEARFDVWKAAGIHDSGDLAKVIGERDTLAKQLAERERAILEFAERVERTMAKVNPIIDQNQDLRKQIADLTKRLADKPGVVVDNAAADPALKLEKKVVIDRLDAMLAGLEEEVAKTAAGIDALQARFQAPPRAGMH